MKTGSISLVALCGLLAGVGMIGLNGPATVVQAQNAETPSAAPAQPAAADAAKTRPAVKPARLSAGLDEIVKLAKAGVDESVILAFIQSSSVAYRPSAPEIIKLRELGISSAITTALLRRGDEVRQRAAQAQQESTNRAVQPAAPAAAPAPTPPATPPAAPEQPTATYYVPSVSYPSVTYASYPAYSYGYGGSYYPRYYSAGYCYPRYYSAGYCSPRYYSGYPRASFYAGYPGLSFGVRFGGHYGGGYRHCR